jgi:hypothetical protein
MNTDTTQPAILTQAQAIAAQIPEGWTATNLHKPEDCNGYPPPSVFLFTRATDRAAFVLNLDPTRYGAKGQARAYYTTPPAFNQAIRNEQGERLENPAIGFSLTQTPEQMARTLSRRLLPEIDNIHPHTLRAIEQEKARLITKGQAAQVALLLSEAFRQKGQPLRATAHDTIITLTGYLDLKEANELIAILTKE